MRKILFITSLVLSIVVGWFFGYINFPFIDQSQSFWVGLIGGLAIMILVMTLANFRSKMNSNGRNSSKTKLLIPLVLTVLLVSVLFLFVKNRNLESRVQVLNEQTPHSSSISSSQQIEFRAIMNSLLDTVSYELKHSKNNTLSTSTIGRIIAFSNTIPSYQFITSDTGVVKKVSPLKGQLLLGLVHMKMDSSSFTQIKRQVSFAGADLRNTNLSGFNLEGIDLKEANFVGSSLNGTNLSRANLSGANFYKTNMQNADLSYSELEYADLSWSNLANSRILQANMVKTNMSNSNLSGADLTGSKINLSLLAFAICNKTDLKDCSIMRTSLRGINLTEAKFVNVSINYSDLADATLTNTQVDSAWLDNLTKWNVLGAKELLEAYKLSYDSLTTHWTLNTIN